MLISHLSAPSVRRRSGNQLSAGWRQLLPALAPSRLDDLHPSGRAHAFQKTVHAPAITLLGLKSPFQCPRTRDWPRLTAARVYPRSRPSPAEPQVLPPPLGGLLSERTLPLVCASEPGSETRAPIPWDTLVTVLAVVRAASRTVSFWSAQLPLSLRRRSGPATGSR